MAGLIFYKNYGTIKRHEKQIIHHCGSQRQWQKTTMAHELVKDENITFLNADEIATKHNDDIGLLSGRILLDKFDKLIHNKKSIILESTISGNYHNKIIEQARKAKYEIILVYVFLDSVEQNLARIKHRVAMGGHNVPTSDVYRRYKRSLKNFWNVQNLVDQWELYYNGENSYEPVARGANGNLDIMNDALYNKFKKEAK